MLLNWCHQENNSEFKKNKNLFPTNTETGRIKKMDVYTLLFPKAMQTATWGAL